MSIIDDCVQFLEDLLVGDFNEQQMVSAQIIGGVISLIPVMDQVMDARDVSGNLYRINKQGGFAKATLEQKIDFGFAAFGVVPEIGSAFKTVFKPIYKQRKAAKGVINSGVAMIELMLGQRKGGAVRWVRTLDWAANTQAAIVHANMALESCIALLDNLGQEHWWCPDRLRNLARDVAPGLKALRGKLEQPIREATVEIKKFLEDMLGEHAAAVALAVAGNAAAVPRGGHGTGAHRASAASAGKHKPIGDVPRTHGKRAQGSIAGTVQNTAYGIYAPLDYALKGLLGEHIVDHYIIEHKKWGLEWNKHDMIGPASGNKLSGWQTKYKKINDNEIPLYLCTPSAHVLSSGIDSIWLTNRPSPHEFAVVEAKASMNPSVSLLQMLGEANSSSSASHRQGQRSGRRGVSTRPRDNGNAVAAAPAQGAKVMQMSPEWIISRLRRDFPALLGRIIGNYSRHVFLVTPLEAAEHVKVAAKLVENNLVGDPIRAQQYEAEHAVHKISREFGEAELDSAKKLYDEKGLPKTKRSVRKNI